MAKDKVKNEAKITEKEEKSTKAKGKKESMKVASKNAAKKAEPKKVAKTEKKSTVLNEKKSKVEKAEKPEKKVTKKAKVSNPKKETKVIKETKKAINKTSKKVADSTLPKAVKKATSKTSNKSTAKPMLAEYYDLPYRYNQTIVKILAQTPTTLFVYWDIADDDRNALISMHGENFFNETRPILVVHNITHNYTFEIEINDFANSWYIRTQEPNCNYVIELGRRYNQNHGEFVYINSSNNIVSPNDHILFENTNLGHILFRNVKTSHHSIKDFGDLKFLNDIDKLYGNIYDVYSALYNDELLNDIANPSSGEFYLKK